MSPPAPLTFNLDRLRPNPEIYAVYFHFRGEFDGKRLVVRICATHGELHRLLDTLPPR